MYNIIGFQHKPLTLVDDQSVLNVKRKGLCDFACLLGGMWIKDTS